MYHHIHHEVVCSKCGSTSHENVSRNMLSWRRCLGCGHEGEKIDQQTGLPFVPYEEQQRRSKEWAEMMERARTAPITF